MQPMVFVYVYVVDFFKCLPSTNAEAELEIGGDQLGE